MEEEEALEALQGLQERQERVLEKITNLAARAGCQELLPELQELDARQIEVLQRIRSLWLQTGLPKDESAMQKQDQVLQDKFSLVQQSAECHGLPDEGKCEEFGQIETQSTEQRLGRILQDKDVTDFRFVRVPADYYSRTLQERRDLLEAPSIFHLCKSIVMVNTQAHSSFKDCSDRNNSKYYLLVVQYCARLNADKVRQFLYSLNKGVIPKSRFNFRLAQEQESEDLTGYGHNAVTPIGMRTQIPVILSDAIPKLKPDFFWLGGGEVDLKLGLRTDDFIKLVKPWIINCT